LTNKIDHPNHYMQGSIETIDYIEACMSVQSFKDVCRANIIKYASRAGKKENELEDIEKLIKYAKFWRDKILEEDDFK
tara:strand:+ start:103 stop:336 length:234 start_codon:yes stop_codon:yes gene_type:complete